MRSSATRKGPDSKGISPAWERFLHARGRMRAFGLIAIFLALAACSAPPPQPVAPQPVATAGPDAKRGELLYETACIQCHTTQAHWRDKRLVRDWPGLLHQVNRWQAVAGQNWHAEEIEDVAEYLNQRFYKLP